MSTTNKPFVIKARLNPLFSKPAPTVDDSATKDGSNTPEESKNTSKPVEEIPVRLASAAPIVAAMAFRPEFANLASPDKLVSERATQDTRPLFAAFSSTAGAIAAMGIVKREAIAATAHVIGEAWIHGDDLGRATENLKIYAKTMIEAKGNTSKLMLGKPSRKELSDPVQSAKSLSARQIAFSAIIDSSNPELTEWFINETRHDSDSAIIAGLNGAPKIIDGQIYTASLVDKSKEIVRLSVAATLAHAEHIHAAITAASSQITADAILMAHDQHMAAVRRNVIEFALASTEHLPLTDGSVPDEISLAQAMGTTVNEIAKIWLNLRVNAYNRVGSQIPDSVRRNSMSDDPKVREQAKLAITKIAANKEIAEAGSADVELSLKRRQLIADRISTVDLSYASTQLKTRAALATYLTDEPTLLFVEGAIDKAARAFSGLGERPMATTRNGVPVILADRENMGLDYMTMHSALRDIAKSALKLEPDAHHVVEALRLSMDAFTKLANIDMGPAKEALIEYSSQASVEEEQEHAADQQEVAA